jgi:hypothetical protein
LIWSYFGQFSNISWTWESTRKYGACSSPQWVLYIGINLYTSNCGHHDIAAVTGSKDHLPLWAHLRPSTCHLIEQSAYLNKWRLLPWRKLFFEIAPGYEEWLETYGSEKLLANQMTKELRSELRD